MAISRTKRIDLVNLSPLLCSLFGKPFIYHGHNFIEELAVLNALDLW